MRRRGAAWAPASWPLPGVLPDYSCLYSQHRPGSWLWPPEVRKFSWGRFIRKRAGTAYRPMNPFHPSTSADHKGRNLGRAKWKKCTGQVWTLSGFLFRIWFHRCLDAWPGLMSSFPAPQPSHPVSILWSVPLATSPAPKSHFIRINSGMLGRGSTEPVKVSYCSRTCRVLGALCQDWEKDQVHNTLL